MPKRSALDILNWSPIHSLRIHWVWESKKFTAWSTESKTVPKKIVSKIPPAQLSGGEQGLEMRVIKVNPLTSLTLRQMSNNAKR